MTLIDIKHFPTLEECKKARAEADVYILGIWVRGATSECAGKP